MNIGISSYTYTWAVGVPGSAPLNALSAFGLVDKASQLNVAVVQIADNLPLHKLCTSELEKLSEYAQSKGISIEVGARALTPNNLSTYLSIAALFHSPILRFVIDGTAYQPDVDTVVGIIKQQLAQMEKENIALALENHDRLHSSMFKQIIETINHPLVGICLDSVNSMGIGEGLESVVENLAPHTVNLHVKDFSVRRVHHKMGFVVEGTPAGEGMLRLPWILEMIKPYGKCSSAILELWTPPEQHLDATIAKENRWAKESIKYLKTVIK